MELENLKLYHVQIKIIINLIFILTLGVIIICNSFFLLSNILIVKDCEKIDVKWFDKVEV